MPECPEHKQCSGGRKYTMGVISIEMTIFSGMLRERTRQPPHMTTWDEGVIPNVSEECKVI